MKNFRFELNGKTWVIIDWANVHGWFQSTKWEIDPKELYNYLRAYKNICEMRLYFGIDNTTDITRKAYKELESTDFTLISKEVKFVPVSLKDSPFKTTYRNALEKLNKIEEGLATIDHFIENLNGQLEGLKEPQMGFDLNSGKSAFVGIDFTPIEDALKILDLISEDFNNLKVTLSELYKIITKEIKRRKCDLDVEITRDIYANFNEIDT